MFTEQGRLAFGFGSPITAGCIIAAIIPWTYCMFLTAFRILRWGKLISALVLICLAAEHIALVLTGSRGPLLAYICAAAGLLLWPKIFLRTSFSERATHVILGMSTVAIACAVTSIRHRIELGLLINDTSISHRLAIWKATPELIRLAPMQGIGPGESGYIFSEWFEPSGFNYRYIGLFNDFLEFAVERGLVLACGLFVVAVVVWLVPFFLDHTRNHRTSSYYSEAVVTAAYMSLCAIIACSMTSSVLNDLVLKALAVGDLSLICFGILRYTQPTLIFTKVCLVALFAGLCFGAGIKLVPQVNKDCYVKIGPIDSVVLSKKAENKSSTERQATILVDRKVLGALYGKTIRKMFALTSRFDAFVVPDPRKPLSSQSLEHSMTIVCVGDTWKYVAIFNPQVVKNIVFLHPSGPPPRGLNNFNYSVLLPKFDEEGVRSKWEQLTNGSMKIRETPGLGQSIVDYEVGL